MLSFDPAKAVDTSGFLTGRNLTVGGVRVTQSPEGYGKKGNHMTFVTLYFKSENDEGVSENYSQKYLAGWSDSVIPSKDGLSLVAPKNASRPGVQKGSPFYIFCADLMSCGYTGKMAGPLTSLNGLEFEAGSKTEERKKKSVDPDEAPKREFPFVVPVNILTEPSDNKGFKPLTDKEIIVVERDIAERRAARSVVASDDSDDAGDEDETPPPAKRGRPKKVAEPEEDEDEDEPEDEDEDSDEDSDDSDEDEDEDEGGGEEKAASKAVFAVLESGAKMKVMALAKAAFGTMSDLPKPLRSKALALVQDEEFLSGLKGITVVKGVAKRS